MPPLKGSACYYARSRTIFVSLKIADDRRAIRSMILHEMIHIGTNGHHGEHFKTALRRLHEKGAPVGLNDRIDYLGVL